jgi:hypothetical protein
MAKNAVLSSFAVARQTSLVVDVGHEATTGEFNSFVVFTSRLRFSHGVADFIQGLCFRVKLSFVPKVVGAIIRIYIMSWYVQWLVFVGRFRLDEQLLDGKLELLYLVFELAAFVARDAGGNHGPSHAACTA